MRDFTKIIESSWYLADERTVRKSQVNFVFEVFSSENHEKAND